MRERTRSRSTPKSGRKASCALSSISKEGTETVYFDGLPIPPYDPTARLPWNQIWTNSASFSEDTSSTESITDVVGNKDGYNPVQHSWTRMLHPLQSFITAGQVVSNSGNTTIDTSFTVTAACPWYQRRSKPSLGDSTENAIRRATSGLELGVQASQFDLGVFLGELRDFKDVSDIVRDGFTKRMTGKDFFKELTAKQLKAVRKKPLKESLNILVTADIIRKFAIEPFINDLKSLATVADHIDRQIERLEQAELVAHNTVIDEAEALPFRHACHHQDVNRIRTVTATCCYKPVKRVCRIGEVWTDSLGLNKPLSIAWELVPLSFVVDYFVGIGEFLAQFNPEDYIPYTLVYEGYSVKDETVWSSEVPLYYYYGWQPHNNVSKVWVQGKRSEGSYERSPGLPLVTLFYPKIALPSPAQAFTLFELMFLSFNKK